jgi:hypothetical protein
MDQMTAPQDRELRRESGRNLDRYNGNGRDMEWKKGKLALRENEYYNEKKQTSKLSNGKRK